MALICVTSPTLARKDSKSAAEKGKNDMTHPKYG